MSGRDWTTLIYGQLSQFPDVYQGEAVTAEQAARVRDIQNAAEERIDTLVIGVGAIGNLLACTASNGTTGLCEDTATNIGWLLEDMSDLILQCSQTAKFAEEYLRRVPAAPERASPRPRSH